MLDHPTKSQSFISCESCLYSRYNAIFAELSTVMQDEFIFRHDDRFTEKGAGDASRLPSSSLFIILQTSVVAGGVTSEASIRPSVTLAASPQHEYVERRAAGSMTKAAT